MATTNAFKRRQNFLLACVAAALAAGIAVGTAAAFPNQALAEPDPGTDLNIEAPDGTDPGADPAPGTPDTTDSGTDPNPADENPTNGWNADHSSYFTNGKATTGAKKIGSKWYAFNAKGELMKEAFELKGVTYYPNSDGVLRARKANNVWYYADNKEMTAADIEDFKCFLFAEDIAAKITDESDDMETKRQKCFMYIYNKKYKAHPREWGHYKPDNWASIYAMDQLDGEDGDCISSAAAFCYLAAAIGYKDVTLCTTTTYHEPHTWCMIDDRIFDPQQARKFKDADLVRFYNVENGSWRPNEPTYRELMKTQVPIPRSSINHTPKAQGLTKSGNSYYFYVNEKKICSTWKTINGKRYWFGANGKAAAGPYKVNGTRYVFNEKGVLKNGAGNRIVKVSGKFYQVTKDGKAKPGWDAEHLRYFLNDGSQVTKPLKIGSRYYVFNSKGLLMKGSKTRVVTISKVRYRVTKSGKAKAGWNKAKTNYFLKNGAQVKGMQQIGKRWYVFDSKGKLMRGKETRVVKIGSARYLVKKDGTIGLGWDKKHTRYYLKNGKLAKGLKKIGKTYYVFSTKGVLKKGKSTRVVKINDTYYQVAKTGKLKPGWNKGRTRYFYKNGTQPKGLKKIDGVYYVFSKKNVLQKGKEGRVVTVGTARYMATKNGVAKIGWSPDHKYLFAGHGTQVKESCLHKNALYYIDANGVYSKSKTSQLRTLAKKGASGSELVSLLGKPIKKTRAESCIDYKNEMGDDALYTYKHLLVQTFIITQDGVSDKGAEYTMDVIAR